MKASRWLPVLALVGGCAPPNASPVALGVPDGMVLGRDHVDISSHKVERVTYAFHNERHTAVVVYGAGPSTIVEQGDAEKWLSADPAQRTAKPTVLVRPGEGDAAKSLLRNLE